MSAWQQVQKLRFACGEQWHEAKTRLEAMGIEVAPWPGVGLVKVDVSELPVDPEHPRVLQKALRRFHPTGLLSCGDHVEAFPLYLRHELEPGNYEDRKMLNPEETVREWVKRIANTIIAECDGCKTSRYFLRCEPTVGFPKGDDFGNWMIVLLMGSPSPVADRLTPGQVQSALDGLGRPSV